MPRAQQQPDQVRIEYVPLAEVQKYPRNPKRHDEGVLQESIDRFGFTNPLLVDETTGQLAAGHGRLERLVDMKAKGLAPPKRINVAKGGEWLVPVIRGVGFKDDNELAAYVVADNRTVELGGWDNKLLADILTDFKNTGDAAAFEGVGWSQKELESILAHASGGTVRSPNTPEANQASYDAGEVKQVVLYYPGDQYAGVIAKLDLLMADLEMDNHSEVVDFLIKQAHAKLEAPPAPAST